MTNPTQIIDRQAERMYEAWLVDARRKGWDWNPFTGSRVKDRSWSELDNHTREVWRDRALAALRSEESVLDELAREDRQRKKTLLSERADASKGETNGL